MTPHEIENLIATCVVSLLALGTLLPLGNALARRIAGPKRPLAPPLQNPGDSDRLDRMERAIEAISVEVERVAEGQRFVTKLLSNGESALQHGAPSLPPGRT